MTNKTMNDVAITIRNLTIKDLRGAMRLSMAEGWNQTEDDWMVFIENPANICLLAEVNNKVIGTTAAINYANEEAWIGMVLVDKEYRGLGVSKSLLSGIFEKLASFKCIKLDATAAGQPVYQKFGFKDEFLVSRMVNVAVSNKKFEQPASKVEFIRQEDIQEIISLDELVFGANREQLIKFLFNNSEQPGLLLRREGKINGFALVRKGSKYYQVGPVVAYSTPDAKILISKSLEQFNKQPVVVDVLCDKKELVDWLNSIGFNRQRDFIRMYKNVNHFPGKSDNLFLICGPEFG